MEFPEMTEQGLLRAEEREREGETERESERDWPLTRDLDAFFRHFYEYYAAKGLLAVLLAEGSAVLCFGFTVAFSVFLVAFVDWQALARCHDAHSCGDPHTDAHAESILVRNPFRETTSLWLTAVSFYFLLFLSLWIHRARTAYAKVLAAVEMERFYREKLGFTDADLVDRDWPEVVDRLVALHEAGRLRMIRKARISYMDVVLRIMRRENYLIALINKNALNLRLPWWLSLCAGESGQRESASSVSSASASSYVVFSQSMEKALSLCLVDVMFDEHFEVSTHFLADEEALRSRFQSLGLLLLVLLPFTALYSVIQFFLQNAQQFRASGAYLGPRQWTPYALWKFREFNELPHFFDERMRRAYKPATDYLQTFPSVYLPILGRLTGYISGAVIAAILLVGVVSESALVFVHVGEANLLVLLGVFSGVFAASRALAPMDEEHTYAQTRSVRERHEERERLLEVLTFHTHHDRFLLLTNCQSDLAYREVNSLLQFKLAVFASEVGSAVLTPLVLLFSLPQCAGDVLKFIQTHTKAVEGVGHVCDYSVFDLAQYGDEDFASAPLPPLSDTESSAHMQMQGERDTLRDGKLEMSYLSFRQNYPLWDDLSVGNAPFMQRLDTYKDMKQSALNTQLSAILPGSRPFKSSLFSPTQPLQSHTSRVHTSAPPTRESVICSESALCDEHSPVVSESDACEQSGSENSSNTTQAQARRTALFTPTQSTTVTSEPSSTASSPVKHNPWLDSSVAHNHTRSRVAAASQHLTRSGDAMLPSVLLSVLGEQRIDVNSDCYWLLKFRQERFLNRADLDQSLSLALSQRVLSQSQSQAQSFLNSRAEDSSAMRSVYRSSAFSAFPPSLVPPQSMPVSLSASMADSLERGRGPEGDGDRDREEERDSVSRGLQPPWSPPSHPTHAQRRPVVSPPTVSLPQRSGYRPL